MAYPAPSIHLPMRVEDFDTLEGAELVTDWNMAAVGVGAEWIQIGGSTTLSKVSNGEGGQALRILHGGSSPTGTRQSGLTNKSAKRVRFTVRARSDGSAELQFVDNVTELFRSSLSTSWEVFTFDVTGSGTSFDMLNGGTSGDYIEIDYVSIKQLTNRTRDAIGSNHGTFGDGVTPTTFPAQQSDKGFIFTNSATARIVISDPLKSTSYFCFSILMKMPANLGGGEFISGAEVVANDRTFYNTNLFFQGEVFTSIGAALYRTAPAGYVYPFQLLHYFFRFDNGTVDTFYDAVPQLNYTSQPGPTYSNQDIYIGERKDGANDTEATIIDHKWWVDVALTDAEILEVFREDLRNYSRLHI